MRKPDKVVDNEVSIKDSDIDAAALDELVHEYDLFFGECEIFFSQNIDFGKGDCEVMRTLCCFFIYQTKNN